MGRMGFMGIMKIINPILPINPIDLISHRQIDVTRCSLSYSKSQLQALRPLVLRGLRRPHP